MLHSSHCEPRTVYLFRHGEVDHKYKKRFRGVIDCDLSPEGDRMSQVNAEFLVLEKVDKVITTGLRRADRVGQLVAKGGIPHEINTGFREAQFGKWEGMSWDEVRIQFPEEARRYHAEFRTLRFPGGESVEEIQKRVLAAWDSVVNSTFSKIAIVGHSTTNYCLMSHLRGRAFEQIGLQTIGSFHEIRLEGTKTQILRENVVLY